MFNQKLLNLISYYFSQDVGCRSTVSLISNSICRGMPNSIRSISPVGPITFWMCEPNITSANWIIKVIAQDNLNGEMVTG